VSKSGLLFRFSDFSFEQTANFPSIQGPIIQNPDNLATEESSPKTISFAFYQKKLHQRNMEVLKGMFKKTSKSVYASTVGVSHYPLFPTPSTTSAMENPGNTEENPNDPDLRPSTICLPL